MEIRITTNENEMRNGYPVVQHWHLTIDGVFIANTSAPHVAKKFYELAEALSPTDWTVKDGRSNSSDEFLKLCREVELIIRGDSFSLLNGRADSTARLIMAQLAHVHHLAPGGRS